MASKGGRKYARDNRGRFASVGATARGGRLRTAGGNKRATVTAKAKGGAMTGAIKGKVKRDPRAAGKIGKATQARKAPKVSVEQRAIATEYKKRVQSSNVKAARAMQREAAKQLGYGTDKMAVKRLTQTMDSHVSWGNMMGKGRKAQPLPLRQQRGNAFSAQKSKDLGFNRRFSDTTWNKIRSRPGDKLDKIYKVADDGLTRHGRHALRASAKQAARRRGR